MNREAPLREGQILTGPLFREPMRVETVRANGADTWSVGLVGVQSEQFRRVTLTKGDLNALTRPVEVKERVEKPYGGNK